MLLRHGFGADWPPSRAGQPQQITSKVYYDPNLSVPFLKSNELSWWHGGQVLSSKAARRLKHTAMCFSSFNEPEINFCDAKLLDDGTIELYFHGAHGGAHHLRVEVRNGSFQSQYWYVYKAWTASDKDLTWTTKQQELTLNKRVYRKGDVIKGRIDFECVQGHNDPLIAEKHHKNPRTMKINGVFKTIVK